MNDNYLDVFPAALLEVFGEIGFDGITVSESEHPFGPETEIIASVGLTGKIQGYMMLSASFQCAKQFVDKMMTNIGMEIEEAGFGQFHKEAMGEMVNQFSGRSVMKLHEAFSIDCNITPPTIITGSNIYADMTNLVARSSKEIQGNFGQVHIFSGIKNIF